MVTQGLDDPYELSQDCFVELLRYLFVMLTAEDI